MGIKSIAIYADADARSPYVYEADLAIHIGASAPAASYLDMDNIIKVATEQGVDAIHPGYGFLSENADFAKKCEAAHIIFIGPNPEAIEAMGSKANAKRLMKEHEVPTLPGYQGSDQSTERLQVEAMKIGFPVLLKATAGGGGKGMRIVKDEAQLQSSIAAAKRESKSAFGDDELIIEKYISSGRHIEFQIFGDKHGNAIQLLERECTIQRRYQKVIEESPSPVLSDELRNAMGESAVQAAKALHYDSAGTVEFIYDEKDGKYYFLEVNTRLQVEHPVTEEVTGLDLVQMQIEVAEGHPLPVSQDAIRGFGYAVEARLYAEDPNNDFMPVTGKVMLWEVPKMEGLRIETAVSTGSEISIHYDPMIAKIIIWDQSRRGAHRKMIYVLRHLKCMGLTTNQDFLRHLFEQEDINNGKYDTHYIDHHFDPTQIEKSAKDHIHASLIATTLYKWHQRNQSRNILMNIPSGWRSNKYASQFDEYVIQDKEYYIAYDKEEGNHFSMSIEDITYQVQLVKVDGYHISHRINGVQHQHTIVSDENQCYIHAAASGNIKIEHKERFPIAKTQESSGGYIAPMPSLVVNILVQKDQAIKKGDALIIISSMKMENTIHAIDDGIVEDIYVEEGQSIEAGYTLFEINNDSN